MKPETFQTKEHIVGGPVCSFGNQKFVLVELFR